MPNIIFKEYWVSLVHLCGSLLGLIARHNPQVMASSLGRIAMRHLSVRSPPRKTYLPSRTLRCSFLRGGRMTVKVRLDPAMGRKARDVSDLCRDSLISTVSMNSSQKNDGRISISVIFLFCLLLFFGK